jgi:hypothetical protein
MTNDKENQMTPVAVALIGLAEEVVRAEKGLEEGPLYWARQKVESVTRDLAEGRAMNSLGELQATGPAFDAAVVRLETAANCFRAVLRALQAEPLSDSESDWLNVTIERSPRLTAIRLQIVEE